MAADVFPATLSTWIKGQLPEGSRGRLNVNQHVMATYEWPLKVYFSRTNSRWLGEPDEVVNGFFANRLAQPDFFDKWLASGMQLRRWLMNSFSYYLMEQRRRHRRDAHDDLPDNNAADSTGPESEFNGAVARAFVHRAMELTAQACAQEGLENHWAIFLKHHVDGRSFQDIAPEFGVESARATVMARTAARKFNAALREVVANDGVPENQIDIEIGRLLEDLGE